MKKEQADFIIQNAKRLKLEARVRTSAQEVYSIDFGNHSTFSFTKYTAARAFLLAFEIEKEK